MRGLTAILSAVLAAIIAAGCGGQANPEPSGSPGPSASDGTVALASPSPSASASPSPSTAPSPSPTATATPTPTATPPATPAPTPVPWQSFASKRYHYKISYPPGWIATPGESTYSDQFDNYSYPIVYVNRDTVSGTISISRTVTSQISYTKSHYKAKLLSNKSIKLASGYVGRILTFDGEDNGLKIRIQSVIVGKGRVGYFLHVFADLSNAKSSQAIFKTMYLSWRPT